MTENKTIRSTLENGLTVLLREIRSAPIISLWVWYRVGSRNEKPGKTGISHWVEHMQFKGTARYEAGKMDRAISRVGGVWNAMTSDDWTTYYETIPEDEVDLILDIEADRMTGSLFLPEEVESERTVILSELEGLENSPSFRLDTALRKAAFEVHPYRNDTIGEIADLKSMTRDDLYDYYRAYYAPNNAVLSMAGNFDAYEMLEKICAKFDSIPPAETPVCTVEPEAMIPEERRVEVHGPGQLTFLEYAWRAPDANDPEFCSLAVLTSILAGPPNLNMVGGGSITNQTSRLYRALVESGLAVGISADVTATIDPEVYTINVVLNQGVSPDQIQEVVDREIERICNGDVSEEEVRKAEKQARAIFIYGAESISNVAFWLGYAEMFADITWFDTYVERIGAVTVEDVIAYGKKWLRPDARVNAVYIPDGTDEFSDLETDDNDYGMEAE